MKFSVDPKIFEKFPDLNLGLVVARGIDNTGLSEQVLNLLKLQEERIRKQFQADTLSQEEKIDAWRRAFSSFGAKPKKYKCSVENLYRMILEGISLKHINKIVDIYNYISLKHMIPVGGDDTDKVVGRINLTIATGTEKFIQLNSDQVKNPKQGEIVYCDEKEVLCRRWNWRECDKSKMTENTKNVALVTEGLPPVSKDEVEKIIKELAQLIEKYCGGKASIFILNKQNPAVDF